MDRLQEPDQRRHDIVDKLDEPNSEDCEDTATEREGGEVLEALGGSGKCGIAAIRTALERIAAGEYEACVNRAAEIAAERLDLLPATPFCGACARRGVGVPHAV